MRKEVAGNSVKVLISLQCMQPEQTIPEISVELVEVKCKLNFKPSF